MKTLKNVNTMYREHEDGDIIILDGPVSISALKSLIVDMAQDTKKAFTDRKPKQVKGKEGSYSTDDSAPISDSSTAMRKVVNKKELENSGITPDENEIGQGKGKYDAEYSMKSVPQDVAAGIIETVFAIKSTLRPVKRYVARPNNPKFGSGIKDEATHREYTAQEDAAIGPRSDVARVYSKKDGASESKVYPRRTVVPNKDAAAMEKTIKPKDFDQKKHGSPSTHLSEPTSSGVDDKIKENIRATGQKDPTNPQNTPKTIQGMGKDVEVEADKQEELKKLQAEENKKSPPKGEKPVKGAPL